MHGVHRIASPMPRAINSFSRTDNAPSFMRVWCNAPKLRAISGVCSFIFCRSAVHCSKNSAGLLMAISFQLKNQGLHAWLLPAPRAMAFLAGVDEPVSNRNHEQCEDGRGEQTEDQR